MNPAERLLEATTRARRRIVVIGDAMVDVYVHGTVTACQDGCPRFVEESRATVPGGAANAANCLQHWDVLVDLCGQEGIARPVKTRFVAADGIVYRHDNDVWASLAGWQRDHALEMVGCASGVLLSDYDKGFLPLDLVRDVVAICARRGIPCVADAKRAPATYGGTILKCNHEWATKWRNLGDVCTAGSVPPLVGDTRLPLTHLPQVACVNHVGAGDCFAAHLTLALACGFPLGWAAAVAHSAGRVYVRHPHNRPPHPAEVVADAGGGV